MSTFRPKDNTGTLFRNKRKEKDTHPNATGTALIDGVEFRVSAWTKKDKNGDPFQSLSFTRSDATERAPAERRQSQGNRLSEQLGDDIPFTMEWR